MAVLVYASKFCQNARCIGTGITRKKKTKQKQKHDSLS
jgi:hypothetical protein